MNTTVFLLPDGSEWRGPEAIAPRRGDVVFVAHEGETYVVETVLHQLRRNPDHENLVDRQLTLVILGHVDDNLYRDEYGDDK